MKRRPLRWNVIPDEGGQALTEFVIVIPILLLFFFAMVQYFSIVQSTQLGNYAAFVAARVYAVNASYDTNALATAQKSAYIAIAPVARPVLDEIGGNTEVGSAVNGVESWIQSLAQSSGSQLAVEALDFGEGYLMASDVRFNSDLLGGSIACGLTNFTSSSPTQVVVTINYPQPIFVPGLTSLWKMLGGTNIYGALSAQSAGLTGIPHYLLPVYAGNSPIQSDVSQLSQYDSSLGNSVQNFISELPTVLLPYIDIQSECAIGYSDWSGIVRLPDTVADSTGSATNNPMAQVEQTQTDQNNYSNAVQVATNACSNETNAYAAYLAAYQQAQNEPTNSQAQAQLQQAEKTYSNFYQSNITAQSAVNNDAGILNQDFQNLGGVAGQNPPTVGGVNCPTCPSPSFLSLSP